MKERILVIDDEQSIKVTFERFLRNAGYEVVTAGNFSEGMAKISEQEFDLIFADIILGGETGIDLLREIRKRNRTCPLVLITGYPNMETAANAVRLGAFDYLSKPVLKDQLLQVAKTALLHKEMIDAAEKYRSNLEAIFRTVKDAIILVDSDLKLIEFNKAAEQFFHFSPESRGKTLELANGRCVDALKAAIEMQKSVELRRIEYQHEDMPGRVVTMTASPIIHPKGAFSGAVMAIKDETRLVALERDLRRRRQFHHIIGKAGSMQEIYTLVEDLANIQTSVLITGESGTGKELLAEAIHFEGKDKRRPLVKVNCSALSINLLESELFGHVRGAFTGAVKDKIGRFQSADGGTIFLDEIGDISPTIQQRLLRVLQDREFERVGDSNPIKVDVRVIAATNKDLSKKVKVGEFREDLYYRLKVVEITLPPLRERKEDVPLLIAHFIEKYNSKLHKRIEAVSEDVLRVFMDYSWPGNVRQLAHTLEHAFVVCHQNIITLDHLPLDFRKTVIENADLSNINSRKLKEREAIVKVLERTAGNKAMAARLLGISRRTIHRKIVELEIHDVSSQKKCETV